MSEDRAQPPSEPAQESSYEQHLDEIDHKLVRIDKRRKDWTNPAANPKPAMPAVIYADELQKKVFPPVRWLVEDIIPEGLGLIGGAPKAGKSRLMYDLAVAVSSGGVFLGHAAVDQAAVLYLALEDNERRMQFRIDEVVNPKHDPAQQKRAFPQQLGLLDNWPRADEWGMELIADWIQERRSIGWNPGLIIIDTFGCFRPPRRSNEDPYEADYKLGRALQKLALAERVAIMLVHHTNKARDVSDWTADISGSRGVIAAQDVIIKMDVERGKNHGFLKFTGREVKTRDIGITRATDDDAWEMTKKMPENYLPPMARKVWETIRQYPGCTLSELLPLIYPEEASKQALKYNHPLYETLRNTIRRLKAKNKVFVNTYHGKPGLYTEPTIPFD